MEPGSFGEIEMNLGFVEKVQAFLHGLPAFDHKSAPPCSFVLCVGHRHFLTTRGAFDDCHMVTKRARTFWRICQ